MTKSVVSTDLKRALFGRGFVISAFCMASSIMLSQLEAFVKLAENFASLQNGYHAIWILDALGSDFVTLVIPILCALPYTTAFIDDLQNGFLKQYLPRCGRRTYIRVKLIAAGLSGGLSLTCGVLMIYALSALIFTPMELVLVEGEIAAPYFAELFSRTTVLFMSGAFWSLMGFFFAGLTKNRYMAYCSPFILYYVLIILHERYFPSLNVLYPKQWLSPTEPWVYLLLAELIVIACLGFALVAERRLNDV